MHTKRTKVINRSGLHARPASEFVLEAKKHDCAITICNISAGDAVPVNAKSIVRLLGEGITQGNEVEISAEGNDEVAAVESLIALLETGFGE